MGKPKDDLTRQELYELVWSVPIRKLAPEYGMSDRGFAKYCRRYSVPVPGRGHWAKVAAGLKSKRTPLPVLANLPVHQPKPVSRQGKAVSKIPAAHRNEVVRENVARAEAPREDKSDSIAKAPIWDGPCSDEKSDIGQTPVRIAHGSFVLDDMIAHDDVLEKFTWLSSRILSRWRRTGAIRFFRGGRGKIWYPRQDLNDALISELRVETPKSINGSSSGE